MWLDAAMLARPRRAGAGEIARRRPPPARQSRSTPGLTARAARPHHAPRARGCRGRGRTSGRGLRVGQRAAGRWTTSRPERCQRSVRRAASDRDGDQGRHRRERRGGAAACIAAVLCGRDRRRAADCRAAVCPTSARCAAPRHLANRRPGSPGARQQLRERRRALQRGAADPRSRSVIIEPRLRVPSTINSSPGASPSSPAVHVASGVASPSCSRSAVRRWPSRIASRRRRRRFVAT